jgi:hypothetical protein
MAIYAELWKWFGTIVSLIHISVGRSDLSSMNRLRNQRNSNENCVWLRAYVGGQNRRFDVVAEYFNRWYPIIIITITDLPIGIVPWLETLLLLCKKAFAMATKPQRYVKWPMDEHKTTAYGCMQWLFCKQWSERNRCSIVKTEKHNQLKRWKP